MTAFVETCVETVAGSAQAAARRARAHPKVRRLLRLLQDKKNILITTHQHPDPDALASSHALTHLLSTRLRDARVSMSIKGQIGGGINDVFARRSNLKIVPWDDQSLGEYDAILLLDTQPPWAYSPLPAGVMPVAVIDHHRSRGRRPKCPFCDIRPDIGSTSSIVFSYFMELEQPIPRDLAATLLFAIETDLAGAAGQPGELDNLALSTLTLMADTRKLYQMRYVDLPQSYYIAYNSALQSAVYYDNALMAHLDEIESLEQPAVIADFLLRFDKVQWAFVTATHEQKLIISIRTSNPKISAGEMARRLLRDMGEGGGHRTKAGGFIPLETATPAEIERKRTILRRRYLRALKIKPSRGLRLVPRADAKA